jgi:hypothetical protein
MLTGEQIERLEALLARAAFGKLSVSETGFLLEDGHMVGDGVYGDAAPAIAEAINAMPVLLQLARAVQSAPVNYEDVGIATRHTGNRFHQTA